jgi:hypothetical protein
MPSIKKPRGNRELNIKKYKLLYEPVIISEDKLVKVIKKNITLNFD